MRSSLRALIAALVLLAGVVHGCVYRATEVLVYLDTNAPASQQLTITATVRAGLNTTGPGNTHTWVRGASIDAGVGRSDSGAAGLDGGITLPATFAIVPGEGPRDGTVTLVVEASLAGARPLDPPTVFRRIARFALTPREQTVVRVFLAVECGAPATGCTGVPADRCTVGLLCEERNQTCGDRGMCVTREVRPDPIDDAGVVLPGMDARVDTSNTGSDARDATDIDAPRTDVPRVDGAVTTDAPVGRDVQLVDVERRDVPCGGPCPAGPNQMGVCAMGTCTRVCNPGFADCDGSAANGCEVNTTDTVAHCGACGVVCRSGPNATAVCTMGSCDLRCSAGFEDCDGSAANGCEVNVSNDVANCGACNSRCPMPPSGSPTCSGGRCGFGCSSPIEACGGSAANGCETDTRSAVNHCGACGRSCPSRPNADATCAASACGIRCSGSWDNCNGNDSDGCETDVSSSISDCGACDRECSPANAAAECSGGNCGYSTCTGGFVDLDGDRSNGCECMPDALPGDCGSAMSFGTIGVGSSNTTGGNIAPADGSDWFSVSFVPGGDARISIVANPGGGHRLEVIDACGAGPRGCGGGGSASGITDWQFNDSAVQPLGGWHRNEGFPSTVFFRVYNTGAPTCANYAVQVAN